MFLDTPEKIRQFLASVTEPLPRMRKVLMVNPDHFDILHPLNPHMVTASGELKKVDKKKAQLQWETLKRTYSSLGFKVEVLDGRPKFPDMVFAANQSFCWWDAQKRAPRILLGKMRSPERRGEVAFFEEWYRANGYDVSVLETECAFEGAGDAILHPTFGVVLGGIGPRTDQKAYLELSERFKLPVIPLDLTTKDFYHLDTCLSILNANTVALYPQAFHSQGVELIKALFSTVIEVKQEEAMEFLSCNSHSPDGKHVIVQQGADLFVEEIEEIGFEPVEVDTSEFIKSGGSVFCMKMMLF